MPEFDDFERELQEALEHRPAPPGLKRKIMERRAERHAPRPWFAVASAALWMKLAATLVIVAILAGGGLEWRARKVEEQRRGEAARQQVLTALRITGHALDKVQAKLAEHDEDGN
ncbi:hypothetical protein [Occallatibacter riparius]|uniref:Uncharacterized protein n=1 Tax=Occallatibacter riparius TaxID=1002689 RepID=A0A9J7BVL5_9BACT|nr:hypothetical protein [Occallatibacter riparius]UWZ85053.1 hypothetical protein MOP44_03700 [Occallatibacter riparius]